MTNREKLHDQKDKVLPLFVECIKLKVRLWDKIRAIEKIVGEIDSSEDIIDNYVVGCDLEEDAEQFTPTEMLAAIEAVLQAPDSEENPYATP